MQIKYYENNKFITKHFYNGFLVIYIIYYYLILLFNIYNNEFLKINYEYYESQQIWSGKNLGERNEIENLVLASQLKYFNKKKQAKIQIFSHFYVSKFTTFFAKIEPAWKSKSVFSKFFGY